MIVVPNGLIIDFGSFVVSGTGNFFFNDGGGIRTSHPNGIGDATHPGKYSNFGRNRYRHYDQLYLLPYSDAGGLWHNLADGLRNANAD